MSIIKEYDAYLTFPSISAAEQETLLRIFADQGLTIDVYDNCVEFSYAGRDSGGSVVKAFLSIAPILRNADSELRCDIVDDDLDDPHFEFYTISNSSLWRQTGRIVRGETVEVPPS